MNGHTHTVSGLAGGLAAAPLIGVQGVPMTVLFAVVVGGYALLPDLDHESSSVSRCLGPVTEFASRRVRSFSGWLYQRTKGPRDEDWTGEHRHATHCLIFAVVVGAGAGIGADRSPWAVVGIVAVGVLLTAGRLGDWVLPVSLVAAGVWVLTQHGHVVAAMEGKSWTVGFAVGLGCLVHDLGDGLTEMGVPLLFPLPIQGETWYELMFLGPLRFRTGGRAEKVVLVLLVALIGWQSWLLVRPDVLRLGR